MSIYLDKLGCYQLPIFRCTIAHPWRWACLQFRRTVYWCNRSVRLHMRKFLIFKILPMLMKYRILLMGNTIEMAGGWHWWAITCTKHMFYLWQRKHLWNNQLEVWHLPLASKVPRLVCCPDHESLKKRITTRGSLEERITHGSLKKE